MYHVKTIAQMNKCITRSPFSHRFAVLEHMLDDIVAILILEE